MAVVNEDPSMVKFLLDNGALVHERAVGNFFCADDQKGTRLDSISHEYFDLPIETDYAGHVYWGEYPLSFAACLELEDCYRLLLVKKADPDIPDTNGNTVIHMTVIVNKINMFDLAFEEGADLRIKNRQGLTPLALAAKLTRTEVSKARFKRHAQLASRVLTDQRPSFADVLSHITPSARCLPSIL